MQRSMLCVFALLGTLGIVFAPIAQAQRRVPDPAFQALRHGNVFIDPRLHGQVDTGTLDNAAGATVKVALWAALPNGPWQNRDDYTGRLHHALHLGRNALIVVVRPGGRGAGVSLFSNGLSAAEDTQLTRQYAPQIKNNLGTGTAALTQAVAADLANAPTADAGTSGVASGNLNAVAAGANVGASGNGHGGVILGIIFLIVLAIVIALIVSASRRKQDISLARGPVEALKANVLSGIEYIDHYMDVLPASNPESEVARTARQAAESKYEQATQILSHASNASQLGQAQAILDRAQADIQQARGALDRALGGTKNIPGDDAFRPPPIPQTQQQVNAVPQSQRAVSFFSGQPAPLGSLVPVTVTVGGQPRQVYATPEEAEEIRRGQMPQVRAFNVGGQYVPWYSYNAYDPYRDYWQYQNNGWGGFGSGALAGFVGAELLNDLTMPRYDYGYSPYAFSPDFAYNQGYDNAMANDQMNNQFSDYGNTGGGFDGGGYAGGDQGGGTDFNDYSGGNDAGGGTDFSDSGGGTDFGGGSDFGGDSGGGSDF